MVYAENMLQRYDYLREQQGLFAKRFTFFHYLFLYIDTFSYFIATFSFAQQKNALPLRCFVSHSNDAWSAHPMVFGQAIQRRRSRADCVSIHKHSKY